MAKAPEMRVWARFNDIKMKVLEGEVERWLDGMTNEHWDKPAPIYPKTEKGAIDVSEVATMRKKMWEEIWETTNKEPVDAGLIASIAYAPFAPYSERGLQVSSKALPKETSMDMCNCDHARDEHESHERGIYFCVVDGCWCAWFPKSSDASRTEKSLFDAKIATHFITEKPTAVVAASAEKTSLKDAEDKIVQILSELDEPMQNLLYKILYVSGIRIEGAELIVRKNFKT